MSTEIRIHDHGPALVKGDFTVTDGQGNAYDLAGKENVALCRCGASANKPFCDGAHKEAGFDSKCCAG